LCKVILAFCVPIFSTSYQSPYIHFNLFYFNFSIIYYDAQTQRSHLQPNPRHKEE